jgi:hypothetical protein
MVFMADVQLPKKLVTANDLKGLKLHLLGKMFDILTMMTIDDAVAFF